MRLVTHNDFDGVACAVLITSVEEVEEVFFAEPGTIQHREMQITENDIISDLPFHPKCGLWFDHHSSNEPPPGTKFEGAFEVAPSAARVVFNFYENPYLEKFRAMVDATDKIDSGQITVEDVKNPQGYNALSLTLETDDIREDREYRRKLIEILKHSPLEEILAMPEVKERYEKKREEQKKFMEEVGKYTREEANVVITDVRGAENPPHGSNYLIYLLHPDCNISVRLFDFPAKPEFVGVSVGHNVFNKTSKVDVGELMKKYKGGGHPAVGGCSLERRDAEEKIKEIISALKG
ncbi:MAG: DHH family phosphoesterase [Candidatus Micrarchaeota archaeon]|nr:DHH family phosphoesterase [Candidatus Micrarchaeota archaeon]